MMIKLLLIALWDLAQAHGQQGRTESEIAWNDAAIYRLFAYITINVRPHGKAQLEGYKNDRNGLKI